MEQINIGGETEERTNWVAVAVILGVIAVMIGFIAYGLISLS